MAHGADRIANLVGDARAQAAERRELRLLDLFSEEAGVFQEHQHGRGARDPEGCEVGSDHATAIGGDKCWIRCRVGPRVTAGALAPGLEKIEQPRRGFADQRIGIGFVVAEHLRGPIR